MVALALCAVAITSLAATVASASAAKFYIEGKELTSKETINVTTTKPVVLAGGVVTGYGKIECEQLSARPKPPVFHNKEEETEWNRAHPLPTIEGASKGTWAKGMYLSGCVMREPSTCNVASPLEAAPTEQTVLGSSEPLSYSFTDSSGTFMTYLVSGCAVEGYISIKGSPECTWAQAGILAVTHKCEFTATSGSALIGAGLREVVMTGAIQYELAGTNAGKKWNMR
jgi:hypothetical protein